MWQNIWTFFKTLLNYDDRLTRVEKQNERLTQKQNELTAELTALYLEMGRMAEREKWREEEATASHRNQTLAASTREREAGY